VGLQLDLSPETSEGALCESICRAAERACLRDPRGVHLNVETLKHLLADVVEEFAVLKASPLPYPPATRCCCSQLGIPSILHCGVMTAGRSIPRRLIYGPRSWVAMITCFQAPWDAAWHAASRAH